MDETKEERKQRIEAMNDTHEELASYVQRIERCLDGIDDATDDLKAVLAEAKGRGFNDKALKKLAVIRRKDVAGKTRGELDDLVLYGRSVGIDLITA